MILKRKERTFLAIPLLMAALVLFGVPAGQCKPPVVKPTPEQIANQVPGVKYTKNLPDNFPVPKYPSNVTSTAFNYSTKGLPAATANLVTSDSKEKVFDWYQQSLRAAGWDVKIPTNDTLGPSHDRLCMLKGIRSKEEVTIMCITFKQKPGTSIDIGWTKTP